MPAEHNPLIQKVLNNVNSDDEIRTLWQLINVNALGRIGMTDHGPIHFQIVANIALKIARTLKKKDFGLSHVHGELVILLASLFHAVGMTINRDGHEEFSLIIGSQILKGGILDFLPVQARTIVIAETLHAIISHRKGGIPYTLEAGIVRVADALDMSAGRSKTPYEDARTTIHSLSHSARLNSNMNARTHDAFAFASLITVAVVLPPEKLSVLTLFASIVGNIVGSLIPDMDQAGNRLWDLLPAGDMVGKVFRRVFYKHRTLSHSLLGMFLIYELLEFVLPYLLNPAYVDSQIVLVSVMVGYLSHLIADSMTKEGLPLFFPFKINIGFPPFEFMRITTGKWVENYVVFPVVGLYTILFIIKYQAVLGEILRSIT